MIITQNRNTSNISQIEATPVKYPFCFTIAGDTAASPNPVGDAIFGEILRQMQQLGPKPLFFANLGDFAGPGTLECHEHYLRLVGHLNIPNICTMGNHDADDPVGGENFARLYGPVNFQFAYGNTCFVAINVHNPGPREVDLDFLAEALGSDGHPNQVVLMHMPPNLNNHYAPHPEWGFSRLEREFLDIVKTHRVRLVCCAHVVAYDYYVYDGIPLVVSGGGGWGLCSHYGGCQSLAMGTPGQRGSFYHFVQVSVDKSGAISGRVIPAFQGIRENPDYSFRA